MSLVNPNKNRDSVNSYPTKSDSEKFKMFPQFFCGIKFDQFRHIKNLELTFNHPITVITGSNKSGKTTALLSIACSHYNFMRRNVITGAMERCTWGNVLKFVAQDSQKNDWTYHVKYRLGSEEFDKPGQRKSGTKKWNGVAKKEGQIGTPKVDGQNSGRKVFMIDMERVVPARHLSETAYRKARDNQDSKTNETVDNHLSYIFEKPYKVKKICSAADRELYAYDSISSYSSYNTASGEDALTRILQDVVNAPKNSLILIEEIELGLHPKIQRRLMDVLFYEAAENSKQFIVTTHSSTILSAVKPESRIFIDYSSGTHRPIYNISINAALTKMDSENYPLADVYVEDELSKKIVLRAIKDIERFSKGFSKLIKPVVIGNANKTYDFYSVRKDIYDVDSINTGYACILDGDMRKNKKFLRNDEFLFFTIQIYLQKKCWSMNI